MRQGNLTELLPKNDQWPQWANEAMYEGRLIRTCMERIDKLEKENKRLVENIRSLQPVLEALGGLRRCGPWLAKRKLEKAVRNFVEQAENAG